LFQRSEGIWECGMNILKQQRLKNARLECGVLGRREFRIRHKYLRCIIRYQGPIPEKVSGGLAIHIPG
jgi:hypothetical protein